MWRILRNLPLTYFYWFVCLVFWYHYTFQPCPFCKTCIAEIYSTILSLSRLPLRGLKNVKRQILYSAVCMIKSIKFELKFSDEKELQSARDLLDAYNTSVDGENLTLSITTYGNSGGT